MPDAVGTNHFVRASPSNGSRNGSQVFVRGRSESQLLSSVSGSVGNDGW